MGRKVYIRNEREIQVINKVKFAEKGWRIRGWGIKREIKVRIRANIN